MSEPRVFVSYSHDNSEWAGEFAEALRDLDVAVWLDRWQIKPGDSLAEAIERGLRQSDAIVVILSASNLSRPFIYFELGFAVAMGKRLILVMGRDVPAHQIPYKLRSRRYLIQESPEETARQVASALEEEKEGGNNMNPAAETEGFQIPEDLEGLSEEEFHDLNRRLSARLNPLRRRREALLGQVTPEFEQLSALIRELEALDERLMEEHRRRQLGRPANP